MTPIVATADRLTISAWSAISPYGIGRAAFVDGVHSQGSTIAEPPPDEHDLPVSHARMVPGFDVRAILGPSNTRAMDRLTGLAVVTVRELLHGAGPPSSVTADRRTAVVLGTGSGSAGSMMEFTRSALVAERPFYVNAAAIPNNVMNSAAGRCAIWHELPGPNATVAGGRAAGLFALSYARRLLLAGRASMALCGAVEEFSRARSWLEFHSQDGEPGVLAEGAAVFAVEPAGGGTGRAPLAELLGFQSKLCLDSDPAKALSECVRRAVERSGGDPADVWAACPSGHSGKLGQVERDVLADVCGAEAVARCAVVEQVADAGAASAAFQLATLLSIAERNPEAAGRMAVLGSIDPGGTVACGVIRPLGSDA